MHVVVKLFAVENASGRSTIWDVESCVPVMVVMVVTILPYTHRDASDDNTDVVDDDDLNNE